MPGWLKLVFSALASFGTTAGALSATGASTKAVLLGSAVATVNAMANLKIDPPDKISTPK